MGVLGSLGQLYMFILLVLLFMGSGFALWSFINHLTKSNTAKTKPVTQQMKINENKERKILGGIKMANNGWFKLAIFSFVGILISMVVLGVMTSNGAQMSNMNNNMNNTMQMSNMQMQNNAQMNNMNGNMQMQGNMNGNMQMGNMPVQGNMNGSMQMTNMPMNNNMPMQGGMQNGNMQMTNDPNAMMMQQLNQMQMQLNQMQQQMNQMNQMNNSGGSSSGSMPSSGGGMGMM